MATPASRGDAAGSGAVRAIAFGGALVAFSFASTRFHCVPFEGGAWYGVTDAAGLAGLAAVALLAALVAWAAPGLEALLPVAGLLVAAVPLVPALTGRLPMLLAPQGMALFVIAVALMVMVLARVWLLAKRSGKPSGFALFALPFLGYLALANRLPGPAGPQGDEPHYLVMAQSLLSDGDFDLADEFRLREYASFYSGALEAHTSPRSPAGRLYSIHAPALPVLIAPAFAMGGYRGAQVLMAALAAATTLLTYRLAHRIFGSDEGATVAWGAAAFIPPLPFYAVAVYPETAAALAVAVFALLPFSGRPTQTAAIALASLLPWLHPKFLPLAAVGVLLVVLGTPSTRERVLAWAIPAASLVLLLLYFWRTYGQATLGAAYGAGLASDLSIGAIPFGILALLLDRQFGLLIHAPYWLLVLPGALSLARDQIRHFATLAFLAAPAAAVGAGFSMWWGGACPPARFLVPTVPVLAVLAAGGLLAVRKSRFWRDAGAFLFGLSLAVVLVAARAPRAIHNRPDGQSALLRLLAPALDLDQFLPSFVIREWTPVRPIHPRPPLRADRAGLALLQDWDPERVWSPLGAEWPRRLEIPLALPAAPWHLTLAQGRASSRFELPPGSYVVIVRGRPPAGPGDTPARLEMRSDGLVLASAEWRAPAENLSFPMIAPVGARRLALVAEGSGGVVEGAILQVETVLPRGLRSALAWPRQPTPETYRLGSGRVRATALDPAEAEGESFRLGMEDQRFAVDAPCGAFVRVRIRSSAPASDRIEWAGREVVFAGDDERVLPMSAGHAFGASCVVPVRVRSPGGQVAFLEQEVQRERDADRTRNEDPPVVLPFPFPQTRNAGARDVRTFQVAFHQAQEGRARRQAWQGFHQAHPGDDDRRPPRRGRPRLQPAPAHRLRQGQGRQHAGGQHQAGDPEGHG
jgi:hypothetical protein